MKPLIMPARNYIGTGAIEKMEGLIEENKFSKCLIITDAFLYKTETFTRVQRILTHHRLAYKVYVDTVPNPSIECVEKAYGMIVKDSCDFVISIGGGSAHDLAKAVSMIATAGGCIKNYVGVNQLEVAPLPLVAINTTSGTGSEVTRFTIITDKATGVKMAIIDDKLVPWMSINDTDALLSMPRGLTAATGMDALTHAIEAYLSTDHSDLTDPYALKAMALIHEHLHVAFGTGSDREAREGMASAQFLAGVAFSNASLGFVHAIAHQLGGIYNLPHGVCNALLLPFVLEAIGPKLEGNRLGDIAEALGLSVFNKNNKFVYKRLAQHIHGMNKDLQIPRNLKELNVQKEDFLKIANHALEDPCHLTSPVILSVDEIIQLLNRAYAY
jgi:alcohol dehydrogenase